MCVGGGGSAAVSFSVRAPVGVCFMISCIMISACISIHGLCIISLSNIYLYASLYAAIVTAIVVGIYAFFGGLISLISWWHAQKRSQDFLEVKLHVHWTDSSIRLDKYKMQFVVRKARQREHNVYTAKNYFSSFWNMRVCIWSDCSFVFRRKGQKTWYIYI